ncbi:Sulfate permease [Minicystis rosea]|nr:Sulfate permease [Minicystis rosea]
MTTQTLGNFSHWKMRGADTVSSWRQMFSADTLGRDLSAGLTVVCVALPLNLALAIASGLPAGVGLVTAVVAGLTAGLLGGARLQFTGPEAALVPVTAEIVRAHGLAGLAVAVLLAGFAQMALGFLRVGRIAKRVPSPVMHGFTAGIGLLILARQIPRFLGLPHGVGSIADIILLEHLAIVGWVGVAVGAVLIATMVFLPRVQKKVPAVIVGLVVVTAGTWLLKLDVTRVGALPSHLPTPAWPAFAGVDLVALAPSIVTLVVLASLGSLLSALSIDNITKATDKDAADLDQELVAQGFANVVSALFGGLPVMGAVIRATVAVDAGARTRAAPLAQAGLLLLAMLFAGPVLAIVPIPALAAILLVVGVRLLDIKKIRAMWANARMNACIVVVTAVAIVATSFLAGVGLGLLLVLAVKLSEACRVQLSTREVSLDARASAAPLDHNLDGRPDVLVAHVQGSLTFLAQGRLRALLETPWPRYVVLDLSAVPFADGDGLAELQYVAEFLAIRGTKVAISGVPERIEESLASAGMLRHFLAARTFANVDDATEIIRALEAPEAPRSHRVIAAMN